jgi:hypothetical protein
VAGWNPHTTTIDLEVEYLQDPYHGNYHNYTFSFGLDDLAAILSKLAHDGVERSPEAVHAAFKGHVNDLIKVLACAGGSKPEPLAYVAPENE